MPRIERRLVERLYRTAGAERWSVPIEAFADALERSLVKRFGDAVAGPRVEEYLRSLHLSDLALACACSLGHEGAWEHFILECRPVLYRAADALDRSGNARELADSLYAELYGLRDAGGDRQSLFRYFHGRSSLTTWLRAILAQRQVDAVRSRSRSEPLAEREDVAPAPDVGHDESADRRRYASIIQRVLAAVVAALEARDRLRLGCYYAEQMTLAEIGRLLGEHEATVSRHLARTRRDIRAGIEQRLRRDEGLGEREIEECFASAVDDPGELNLSVVIAASGDRKKSPANRSTSEGTT